jgi:hypothetical protein
MAKTVETPLSRPPPLSPLPILQVVPVMFFFLAGGGSARGQDCMLYEHTSYKDPDIRWGRVFGYKAYDT